MSTKSSAAKTYATKTLDRNLISQLKGRARLGLCFNLSLRFTFIAEDDHHCALVAAGICHDQIKQPIDEQFDQETLDR